jgi:hypothetical protein
VAGLLVVVVVVLVVVVVQMLWRWVEKGPARLRVWRREIELVKSLDG